MSTNMGNELFIAPGAEAQQTPQLPTPPASTYMGEDKKEEFSPEDLEGGVKRRTEQQLKDFLELAIRRQKISAENWEEQRALSAEDMRFRLGDQWPTDIRTQREIDKRPCLTVNRIPQFIRQITNDERQNRPSIHVTPMGEHADKKTAEIVEGLIRSIEYDNADTAYDTAFDFAAATGGPGWLRVLNVYADDKTSKQKLVIKRVLNPFTVYCDPFFEEPDGSDIQWAFVVEDYTHEEYKEEFGEDAEAAGLTRFHSSGDNVQDWITEKNIRVAEYWYKEKIDKVLVKLADDTEKYEDELTEEEASTEYTITRRLKVEKVRWAKFNAKKVLEERQDYKGKFIPLIPVLGEELISDGKRRLSGVVRYAKDPQRAYNYWTSAQTEMIALAPKAPFLIEVGQLKGVDEFWKDLNTKNRAYLPYKASSIEGKPVPPPSKLSSEPPIQATALSRAQAADDLKATTGLYDASVGAQGNETSGRAILARQREGDVANFHLIDNLTRSIRHTGRILVDLIPYVYDTPRIERIIGVDQKEEMVHLQSSLNPGVPELEQPQDDVKAADRIYDLGVGEYDVAVIVGPSYTTRRQEAAASMVELTRNYPQFAQVAGDLMVKSMDWPLADKIADRIHKMLPPELQEPEEGEEKPKIPPQVQAEMQQLMQQHEALTELVNKLTDERDGKVLEIASKERIAGLNAKTELLVTEAKLRSAEGVEILRSEIQTIGQRLDILSKFEAEQGIAPAQASISSVNEPEATPPITGEPQPVQPGAVAAAVEPDMSSDLELRPDELQL